MSAPQKSPASPDALESAYKPRIADIFVPNNQIREFKRKHSLQLVNLRNGVRIIGISQGTPDSLDTRIEYTMPYGGAEDPKGQEGITHFLEHMFVPKILRQQAGLLGVRVNAHTSAMEVAQVADGLVNPEVPEYGLKPLLPSLRDALFYPLQQIDNPEAAVNGERGAILGEITRKKADHSRTVWDIADARVYALDNPSAIDAIGTEESVSAITAEDIARHAENVLIPDGLTIRVFTEGKATSRRQVIQELSHLFKLLPREWKKSKRPDWEKLAKLHPDVYKGGMHQIDTGLRNNQVSALIFWPVNNELFGQSHFALRYFTGLMRQRLHLMVRDQGLGYVDNAGMREPGGENALFYTQIDFRKWSAENPYGFKPEEFPEKFSQIMDDLLGNGNEAEKITDADIEEYTKSQKIGMRARPTSREQILNWAEYGLRKFGQMVDAEKVNDIYTSVTPQAVIQWRDTLAKQQPMMLLVGDLPDANKAEK